MKVHSLPKLKIVSLSNISEVFGSASLFLLQVLNQISVKWHSLAAEQLWICFVSSSLLVRKEE